MGNCFGAPVNNHSPGTTKPSSPAETSGGSSKKHEWTPRSNSSASQNGNVVHATMEEKPQTGRVITPNLKLYSLAELKTATRNFRPDTVLGEGGFGTGFQGLGRRAHVRAVEGGASAWLLPSRNRTLIAARGCKNGPQFKRNGFEGLALSLSFGWLAEVKFLGKFSHPNLVKLLGYCWEDRQYLLVYEHMQKGSLENHLFKKAAPDPIPWDVRLKIAIERLGGSPSCTHQRRLQCKALSDFGLAKLGPVNGDSHVTTRVMGTYGYAAPEYVATGHLYIKSDVYGFGVVLLEMLTGLRAHDTERLTYQQNLVEWAKPYLYAKKKLKKIMDSRLRENYPLEGAFQAAQLILKCLEADPKHRPSMAEVLKELEVISAIKMTAKETKASAKQGTSRRHEEHSTRQPHHSSHPRSPIHPSMVSTVLHLELIITS
ncbi:putative serine/threonine-protein kinase Cx32, chloroplastic [Morella rubra]|uniref:Putative serine/threonine-protein kinase Cx32, chloroplastic n=1 Tax=Morella rubra TaxID=262757 RepID=A0A6A1W1X2_9ROSI|nr:putative serine/threonine-protein kinase Cx32, chloroplastic [Morella rubra]